MASCKCEICDVVAAIGKLIVHDAERLVELTRGDELASLQLGLAVKLAEVKPHHNALNKFAAVRTHSGVLGWNEKASAVDGGQMRSVCSRFPGCGAVFAIVVSFATWIAGIHAKLF